MVKSGSDGLLLHRRSRRFEGDEYADLGLFPFQHSDQIPDVAALDVPALNLHQGAFGPAAVVIDEIDQAVDAFIRAFFLLTADRTGFHQRKRPPLELVAVVIGELPGGLDVFRFADDAVIFLRFKVEGILQAVLHERNG